MQVIGNGLKRGSAFALVSAVLFAMLSVGAQTQVDMLTQHNDNARTGVNAHETALTPANVNSTQFGMLFKRVVDDQIYTQPLIVTGVTAGGGTLDLVYVTTVNNSVYAFDADGRGGDPACVARELWNASEPAQREFWMPGHQWSVGHHRYTGDR